MAKAAGRCPAGICNQGLQGWKAHASKSRLEEGSEALHCLNRSCHQPHSLDSRTDCDSVHFRLQCQGMPSFTKQGQGFADTASVKGWALQAPAELNLAGSFMWQQIKQWQQRWSPAAHRTSASMGTRPLSRVGLFWLTPASCSAWCLGVDSQHIEEQSQA